MIWWLIKVATGRHVCVAVIGDKALQSPDQAALHLIFIEPIF